jgi:two-component system sensor histidine kinase YesM
LVLIVPIGVVCIFYYREFQTSLLNDANNKLKETLTYMETSMNTNLDTIDAVIHELNYRQEFSYFLDEKNMLSEREQTYYISSVQGELINIRYLYPNKFYYIAVFSSNTQVEDKFERQYKLEDLKKKPYYKEILDASNSMSYGMVRNSEFKSSNINVKDLNLDKKGIQVLPIYLKIYNLSTKQIVGVIEVDMEITKLIKEENLPVTETMADYLLFDQNNQMIYQTGTFKTADFVNLTFKNEKDIVDYKIGNKTYLLAYSRCGNTGLMRAVIIAKHNVLAYSNSIIVNVILVAISSMLIVFALIYWIIKKMLKRLVVLDEMMAKIEGGDFDVSIQDNGEADEIARISRSFNRMASRLHSVLRSAIEKEKAQKEAELKALQAQINPHFLYNTLENMRMQCEMDEYQNLGDNLAALGDLFRYSIKWGSNQVPFELEWANLENYISIMKMRFAEDMTCIMECEEHIGDIIVPKLLLQPLVENSFNHGFRGNFPPWRITIRAFRQMDKLIIEIEDNGSGIREERLQQIWQAMEEKRPIEASERDRNSIGIINVQQRLDMICKEGSKIEISSKVKVGTKIVITIILEEE